jgi:protoporphyrinogen oxidase
MTGALRNGSSLEAPVVIIGAGPAGLTAAYELSRVGTPVLVLEQDAQVGGLARTVEHNGFRFDIGGHRFFTKVPVVEQLWRTVLGPDFLKRPRLSRIYYRGRFFQYPLRPFDVAWKLGLWTSALVLLSYAAARVRPLPQETSFADWVTNRFGRRLYRIFFKTYTEKVWGIPCERISAQWAAQRIKGLSLRTAVSNMFASRDRSPSVKTLITEFEYPRLGPGMMWERFAQIVESGSGRVELGARVTRLLHDRRRIEAVEYTRHGLTRRSAAGHVISTMPVPHLVDAMMPAMPAEARTAAYRLSHRDFLTVALMLEQTDVFPDNWIYIHDDAVRVGRIQNYKNWSPDMVPDPAWTCLGLEYFCSAGDDLWTMTDDDLVALATTELARVGLGDPKKVRDGVVVRVRDAYPVYDAGYLGALEIVKTHLAPFTNLQLVGRNGMHKYNNQDHSMLTALLAVRNLQGAGYDLWSINAEDDYYEETSATASADSELSACVSAMSSTQPLVPSRLDSPGH